MRAAAAADSVKLNQLCQEEAVQRSLLLALGLCFRPGPPTTATADHRNFPVFKMPLHNIVIEHFIHPLFRALFYSHSRAQLPPPPLTRQSTSNIAHIQPEPELEPELELKPELELELELEPEPELHFDGETRQVETNMAESALDDYPTGQPCWLFGLPHEILSEIFDQLHQWDLCALCLASSEMHSFNLPRLLRTVELEYTQRDIVSFALLLQRQPEAARSIVNLHLKDVAPINEIMARYNEASTTSVERVMISSYMNVLKLAIPRMARLRTLVLANVHALHYSIHTGPSVLTIPSTLTELEMLQSGSGWPEWVYDVLSVRHPSLMKLQLRVTPIGRLSDEPRGYDLSPYATTWMPTMKELTFHNAVLAWDVGVWHSLRSLELRGCVVPHFRLNDMFPNVRCICVTGVQDPAGNRHCGPLQWEQLSCVRSGCRDWDWLQTTIEPVTHLHVEEFHSGLHQNHTNLATILDRLCPRMIQFTLGSQTESSNLPFELLALAPGDVTVLDFLIPMEFERVGGAYPAHFTVDQALHAQADEVMVCPKPFLRPSNN